MTKKFFLGLFILLVATLGVILLRATPAPPHLFFSPAAPLAIAHRGGMGLWPENTLYAFQKVAELGVDVLEMDVRSTADGTLVILHDADVDRTTNGKGPVAALSLKAVKELDAGYHWSSDHGQTFPFRGIGITVPTLREVLNTLPSTRMSLEMKEGGPSLATPLCRTLREYGKTKTVLVSSFDRKTLKEFRLLCPEVATSASEGEVKLFYTMARLFLAPLYSPAFHALQVPEYSEDRRVAAPRFIQAAHGRNLAVTVWTVNEEADMKRLLALGADGIITDYPDRLLKVLERPLLNENIPPPPFK